MESMRIDKWLWAARFYKTRSLASDEIGKGRVHVNALQAKPAREVKAGDTIALRQGPMTRTVRVLALSLQRGAGRWRASPGARRLPQMSWGGSWKESPEVVCHYQFANG